MSSFPPPKPPNTGRRGRAGKEQIRPKELQHGRQPSETGDANDALTATGASGEKDMAIMPVNEENYQLNIDDMGSKMQTPSRSLGPQIWMRDPADSHNDKKARRACIYHAKGWCIRGKSCSFYHDEALGALNRKAISSDTIPPRQSGDSNKFGSQNEMVDLKKDGELGSTRSQVEELSQQNSHMDSFRTGDLGIQSVHHPSLSSSLPQGVPTASYLKILSSDWVPSVPFRPSHVITRNLLVKENLYEPLYDSGHQTTSKDGPLKFSGSHDGLSVKNEQNQVGMRSYPKMDLFSGKDASAFNFTIDNLLKLPDRYFEDVLIKYVKYLLEPAWAKGLISKECFKLIVKKSVDKVIKSFHPRELPSSYDSIKSYIYTSQTKIGNLVRAYFKKYGRSRHC